MSDVISCAGPGSIASLVWQRISFFHRITAQTDFIDAFGKTVLYRQQSFLGLRKEFSLTVSMQRYSWVLFPAVGLNFHTVDDFDASDFRTRRTPEEYSSCRQWRFDNSRYQSPAAWGSVRRDIRSFDKAGVDAAVSFSAIGRIPSRLL